MSGVVHIDVEGDDPLGGGGIVLGGGAFENTIGPDNILSGIDVGNAVVIIDPTTTMNKVIGNYFGLSADGTVLVGNQTSNIAIEKVCMSITKYTILK